MKKHVLAAALLLSTITSFGSGYLINLEGLRQVAMGGTGAAWPWDVSTIYYNPGALARLKGIQAYASIATIMPSTAFGNIQSSARSLSQTFTPFNVYIGGPIQEGSKFALGLGIYTPAGEGLNWGNSWTGRYIIENIELQAVFFQPIKVEGNNIFRQQVFIAVKACLVNGQLSLGLFRLCTVITKVVKFPFQVRDSYITAIGGIVINSTNATGTGRNNT